MKKLAMSVALSSLVVLAACQPKEEAPATSAALETPEQRFSYGMAYNMGERMVAESLEVDADAFAAGVQDALSGAESKLTDEEIAAEMAAFQTRMQAKMETEAAEAGAANAAEGEAFLAENATKEGVMTTESGLQYKVESMGDGAKPAATDVVRVHYRGTLLDGEEFDSSYSRGEPAEFGLNQVIAGWTEGLQLMPVGSKFTFYIPSDLAYGSRGAGAKIGPSSTLIFEVELLDIVTPAE
jgi:FKBP-type peptidyl-prolyl cis-trans isomerase